MIIREGVSSDLEAVLSLNQEEAKWTSDLDASALERLVSYATAFLVVIEEGVVVGFVIVMAADSDYPNDNLEWFRSSGEDFWYVDRIVVSSTQAGKGLGRQLYEQIFSLAKADGATSVTCEYSLSPMNEGSAVFHERLGFKEVGRRRDTANNKQVSMQQRALP